MSIGPGQDTILRPGYANRGSPKSTQPRLPKEIRHAFTGVYD